MGVAGECPAALVQEGVVVAAHQDEVVEGGGSAVVSGDYVVDVAPLPGPVTAVELAVVVSERTRRQFASQESCSMMGHGTGPEQCMSATIRVTGGSLPSKLRFMTASIVTDR